MEVALGSCTDFLADARGECSMDRSCRDCFEGSAQMTMLRAFGAHRASEDAVAVCFFPAMC